MTNSNGSSTKKPVVLCILDGWGQREEHLNNAIKTGNTPHWDHFLKTCPSSKLSASGVDVGLPERQMGNSEVGHMTIGSGRVVLQDLPRIDEAIHDGSLDKNPDLLSFIDTLIASKGTCHLMGLLSDGGVHSHQWHLRTLAGIVSAAGVPVKVHAFLDGRDTAPKKALSFVQRFAADIRFMPGVSIATVIGRYWAMDRDDRWERVAKAYDCMVDAKGQKFEKAVDAITAAYDSGITDEFVEPTVLGDYDGMKDGDGLLMGNFRADRAREILSALGVEDFGGFERSRVVNFAGKAGMVNYSENLKAHYADFFPPVKLKHILAEVISAAGRTQLHVAETEKYAHVTFFFNGGRETPFDGEQRSLIPSPKVATYDLQPEMSAAEVTDTMVTAIESGSFDFIVVNYANGDMVGHTGDMRAAVKAVEAVDDCLGRLETAIEKSGGTMLITADHGNCEKMVDNNHAHTAHTLFPVPAVLVNGPTSATQLHDGSLIDLAPTLLGLMGIDLPAEMTGRSLIEGTGGAQTADTSK